jgi:hypothetical protein
MRTPALQYFPSISTLHRATPNFNVRIHAPIFSTHPNIFTVHHAFLVCTPAHIPFYAHQFLVTSATEIGAFANLFPNFHHRHSATMKFVQFHPDNTHSTCSTTNRCWLTFLEQFCFSKLNSQIENFNQLVSLHLSWLPCNFKFDQFQV